MKHLTLTKLICVLRICIGILVACLLSLLLLSFTLKEFSGDFLGQLGISKTDVDKKISGSILRGYLDHYGIKNAKNIALGNRSAVVKDLLVYTKKYASSADFIKAYNEMRNGKKPTKNEVQTPEEMRSAEIAMYKKSVADNEAILKKADASIKAIFEKALEDSKKGLIAAEDVNNKGQVAYKKNYPALLKMMEEGNQRQINDWEAKYPADHLQFVKKRLEQFMKETSDIDFSAELQQRNGKNYFVNKVYEAKSSNWKLAFRTGKEVVEPARAFVQQWLSEL